MKCSAGTKSVSVLSHRWMWVMLKGFLAAASVRSSSWTSPHVKTDLLFGQLQILLFKGLKTAPSPICSFPPIRSLLTPPFLWDMCFKVRHRSICLFPAFLRASLSSWASLSFTTAALMDCQLRHYCTCTVHLQRNTNIYNLVHQHVYSPIIQIPRLQEYTHVQNGPAGGVGAEKLPSEWNMLTSAAVYMQALKQTLHFACSALGWMH